MAFGPPIRACAFRVLTAAALAVLVSSSAFAQSSPIVMKLGSGTLNDSIHEWMKLFAADIDKTAGGRIKVEIYPASQLGSNARMVEQTQFGTIQGYCGAPEFMAGIDTRYQLLSAPGVFNDFDQVNRVLRDPQFEKAFFELGAEKGLKGIALMISGSATFASREPIRKLSDFEGKKIRVFAGRLQQAQMAKLKASPVPMALGEALPALQSGTLDGVLGGIPVLTRLRFSGAAKYLTETNHSLITGMTVINKAWFDKLPRDLQDAVMKSAAKASDDVFRFSVDDIDNTRKTWIADGGEVIKLAPAEQEKMMKELREAGAEELTKNPRDKELYDLLISVADRTAR
jgi:TRAP-type C4-dicarboxylate transport system substrate-binding protein